MSTLELLELLEELDNCDMRCNSSAHPGGSVLLALVSDSRDDLEKGGRGFFVVNIVGGPADGRAIG